MSEKRNQFTFYRSYWEAMKGLGKRDRQAILEAVIGYALDGQMAEGLSGLQMAMFSLIKPTLDSGRKKAVNGRIGGSKPEANGKQTVSKPEAKCKQNRSEKETEVEEEVKKEVEAEKEYESREMGFPDFWRAYPVKIGEDEARAAWKKMKPEPQAVLAGLEMWKNSEQWNKDGGKYIPRGAKFLLSGYYKETPRQADARIASRELDPEEQAAIRRMMEEDNDAGTS